MVVPERHVVFVPNPVNRADRYAVPFFLETSRKAERAFAYMSRKTD